MNLSLTKEEVAMMLGIVGITSGKGLAKPFKEMYEWLQQEDELLLEAAIRMGKSLGNEYETHGLCEEEELATAMKSI